MGSTGEMLASVPPGPIISSGPDVIVHSQVFSGDSWSTSTPAVWVGKGGNGMVYYLLVRAMKRENGVGKFQFDVHFPLNTSRKYAILVTM